METKILLNSVISDAHKGARFLSADLKDHFLQTPMPEAEYMKIPYNKFPEDIREFYNLSTLVSKDGYIFIKVKKAMYGLKQAAILAYRHIKNTLQPHGYYPVVGTVGLLKHKTRPISFCLCVDDFGIIYFHKQDVEHLLEKLDPFMTIPQIGQGSIIVG